jgi:hypothetical protein
VCSKETNSNAEKNSLGRFKLTSASLIFILILLYLRWPVINLFSTHLLGGTGGDSNLYFWLVTTFPKNILERGWFETNSFYPYHNTLAWSDNFLFPSCLFYILREIFGLKEIVSWNLLILSAQLLNGLSVFLLAKELKGNWLSSFLLGSIFIVSPYFAEQLGHPQLQFFFFIPVGFIYFLRLLKAPSWPSVVALSLIVSFCFLTTVYYAIALVLLCFLYLLLYLMAKQVVSKKSLLLLLTSAMLTGLILLAFIAPYLKVKEAFGSRGLHEFYHFSLTALSFFAAAPISDFYGGSSALSHGEAHFGWGLVSLLLLCLGAKRLYSFSRPLLFCLVFALLLSDPLVAELFNLGRAWRLYSAALLTWTAIIISIFQLRRNGQNFISGSLAIVAAWITLIAIGPLGYSEIGVTSMAPFRIFYTVFPGIDSLRAISRLGSVVILLLSLASIPTLNAHKKTSLLLLTLLIIESQVSSFPLAPLSPTPRIFSSLPNLTNKDSAILIAPLAGKLDKNNQIISWSEVAEINSQYLVALRESAPLLMNGYSGQRPRTIYDLPRIMQRFPSQGALDKLLEFENLDFLLILGSKIEEFSEVSFLENLSNLGESVSILTQDGKDFLIKIERSPH